MIRLTTDSSVSSYGVPVIIDGDGKPMSYAEGLRSIRRERRLSVKDLAEVCKVSRRTVEDWEQERRNPNRPALYHLMEWINANPV